MFKDYYRGKKVLITGHTGFKGSWLSAWLLKLGAEVIGFSDQVPSEPALFEVLGLSSQMHDRRGNLQEAATIRALVEQLQPDLVFHMAAQAIVSLSYQDPLNTLATNMMGTAHVLDALRGLNKPSTAIIITSDKCYDNVEWVWGYREQDRLGGKDIYSASKAAAELVYRAYFESFFRGSLVRSATVRAGNVIGGGDWSPNRVVPDAVRAWSQGQAVTIRQPKATRPWQHVLEPLSGYLHLGVLLGACSDLDGESFNFGPRGDQNTRVVDLLTHLALGWDLDHPYTVIPDATMKEAGLLKLNCDKALVHLHWEPTLLYAEMVEMVSGWYRQFYQEKYDMREYTLAQIAQYEALAVARGLAWSRE